MKDQQAEQLIQKYLEGKCSPEETALLHTWYNQRSKSIGDDLPELDYAYWQQEIGSRLPKRVKKVTLWPRIAAAAVLIIVAGTGFFYFNQKPADVTSGQVVKNDIVPGKQGATLTLANGKKIRLTDAANGELAREAGVVISKTASGQLIYEIEEDNTESKKINILTTNNGETYQVRLPDGSTVWLNAASSLKYPASFARLKKRRVELSGEGYFEVAKDNARPFIVMTADQEVEVLGTHFNVNAYADENAIATTLLEGSVKVNYGEKNNTILKPGQQAQNNAAGLKVVNNVDIEGVVAWKNGVFIFNDESLESIMRKVERWYDVKVIYRGVNKNERYGGSFSRYAGVSGVLRNLELAGGIHFKIENKTIYVAK